MTKALPLRSATVDTTLRRTPLYEAHREAGARIVPFAGWEMPVQYAGIKAEHHAVRAKAGLFDVSHMGELEITGAHALAHVDRLVTNDVASLPVGKALYTVCCNEFGMILDDLIVYRLAEETVWIVCNASNREKIATHVEAELGDGVRFADRSDELALLALQGPAASTVAQSAGASSSIVELKAFEVAHGSVAGVDCVAARTGYTGEDGFELFVPAAQATQVWGHLIDKGAAHGLQPVGLGARDTLRLEAKLALYGNDIDEETDPLSAGLGWVVKLEKADFIGKSALNRLKKQGTKNQLVGFEMTGHGIARHGYPITVDDRPIGRVTSGSPGPSVGKNIGLGYVPRANSRIGTKIGYRNP